MIKIVPRLFCASQLVSQGIVGLILALWLKVQAGLKSAAKILSVFFCGLPSVFYKFRHQR